MKQNHDHTGNNKGNDGGLKPPIILFGNYRSGTSLVQNMIALHPEIVKWYEPRTMWLYADPGRRHDEFDENDATENVVSYVRQRFLNFQRQNGNRRVMEKTPANILKIPYVNAIFPEAIILYIVRTPFSFISSSELKWQRTISRKGLIRRIRETPTSQILYYTGKLFRDYFGKYVLKNKYVSLYGPRYKGIEDDLKRLDILTVIARQWSRCSKKAEMDLAELGNDRVLRLRYEDIVADPVTYMEKICAHCGLEMTPEMARAAKEMADPNRQDKWRRFDPESLGRLLPEIEAEMSRHGYSVPSPIMDTMDTDIET
jgi:hypothetical protein